MPVLEDVHSVNGKKHFLAQLDPTDILVKPGTKIDSRPTYYRDELLLLPANRNMAVEVYIYQQDSAQAHRARQTVKLLRRETPELGIQRTGP